MAKLYSISYDHIGGERDKQTTSIFQLAQWIEEMMNEPNIVETSIVINTTEKTEEQK